MAVADNTLGRYERQCAGCGTLFKIEAGRGQARMYCGADCRPHRKKPTKLCDVDGCAGTARSDSARHCEKHYYQIRRIGRLGTVLDMASYEHCQFCGSTSNGRKFCDARCRARHDRGNPVCKACVVCMAEFDPRSGHGPDADVCGEACKQIRSRDYMRAFYARSMQTDRGKARVRRAEYKRKARKSEAFIEVVEWAEVMDRGKWTCHLCGEPISKRAKWPELRFGTVDHVLPLAEGGQHSYANCKPAHLSCNCKKGSRLIGQPGLPLAA